LTPPKLVEFLARGQKQQVQVVHRSQTKPVEVVLVRFSGYAFLCLYCSWAFQSVIVSLCSFVLFLFQRLAFCIVLFCVLFLGCGCMFVLRYLCLHEFSKTFEFLARGQKQVEGVH
jgi:hypothetical protein